MYAKGDYIYEISNGLCRMEEVMTLEIAGVKKDRLYYRMQPVGSNGSTVFIPVDKSEGMIRRAMTCEEAKSLIAEMPSIETLWISDERTREKIYKEALFSLDYRSWVKIIKTLYLRKLDRRARGQKVTSKDEQYLRLAEDRLYGELSFVLGRRKEDMEGFIIEQLKKAEKKQDKAFLSTPDIV